MPSFEEELNSLGSSPAAGRPSFDDELAGLQAEQPMGKSPDGGISFSAKPSDVADWNAGKDRPPVVEPSPRPSWTETATDAGIGLGEGVLRGVGINPARAAGFLAERGAQVSRYFGGDVEPGAFGARAERTARILLSDAHKRSPMAAGMAEGLGEAVPGLAVMGVSGGVVNPVTLGAATGALSGLGNSEARDFGTMATDAAEGAAVGALSGGLAKGIGAGSKYIGSIGRRVGDWADEIADSPMTRRAAQWAGMSAGGSAGSAVGSALGPAGTAAGGFLGGAAGAAVAERAIPGAIRSGGNVVRGLGEGAAAAGGNSAAQGFAGQATAQQYGRHVIADQSEKSTDAGRGNLLGEAALAALQHDPGVLGDYAGDFARAAASPDTGAVNALINKLAAKDSKFRIGPMAELQRMTAEF